MLPLNVLSSSISQLPLWISILIGLAILSAVLTRVMVKIAPKLGLVDIPEARRIHHTPIPRAGGIAVFATLLIGLLLLSLADLPLGSIFGHEWIIHFLLSSTLIVVIGVIDDRRGMSAWVKLLGQILASVIMFTHKPTSAGILLHMEVHWVFDLAAHVGWTIILINGFNLIDGMDGLCSGLGIIALSILSVLAAVGGQVELAILCGVMIAALAGFMRYNFHPARIFLGDTGSMLIGFFIATIGAAAVGRPTAAAANFQPRRQGGHPRLDVGLAVWRR
ncbi:MAG: glycosyltransferase family 4 protein, partial [Verrucomicrobiales bacterium]